ncbi:Uncharacterised protein [Vibrio cholerae]|nr:Uncharacterised protein [Vibrio cholerae]
MLNITRLKNFIKFTSPRLSKEENVTEISSWRV